MAQFISAGMAQSSSNSLQNLFEELVKHMRDMNHKIDAVRGEVRSCQQQIDRLHRSQFSMVSNGSIANRRISTASEVSHQSPASLRSNPAIYHHPDKGKTRFRRVVKQVIKLNRERKRLRRIWKLAIFRVRKSVRREKAERALSRPANPLEKNWATRREWTISRISSDLKLLDSIDDYNTSSPQKTSLTNIIQSLKSSNQGLQALETTSVNDGEENESKSSQGTPPVDPQEPLVVHHFAKLHDRPTTMPRRILAVFEPERFEVIPKKLRLMGSIVNTLSFLCIIISTIAFCLETMPDYNGTDTFFPVETFCVAYFTLELLIRFIVTEHKRKFWLHIMNVVDLLAIIPYFLDIVISLAGSSVSFTFLVVLRVLRLVRVVRVLKLSRHHEGIRDVGETILKSQEAFTMMIFLLAIMTVVFSSIMYFAEQTVMSWEDSINRWVIIQRDFAWSEPRQQWEPIITRKPAAIQSIPHAFWWCIVSLTTVGYGDVVPISGLGKFCGGITLILGILTIALPTMILSVNFQQVRQMKSKMGRAPTFRGFGGAPSEVQNIEQQLDLMNAMGVAPGVTPPPIHTNNLPGATIPTEPPSMYVSSQSNVPRPVIVGPSAPRPRRGIVVEKPGSL